MEIEGKCPHCAGKGCDKCDEGIAIFTIEDSAKYYTRHCSDCGFDNGGCHEDYLHDTGPCVMCDGDNVNWELL